MDQITKSGVTLKSVNIVESETINNNYITSEKDDQQQSSEKWRLSKFSPLYRQLLAAGAPIIATITAGLTTGYSAILLPQLQSNSSSIHITNVEASWIASVAVFGMAPGCLIGGIIMQKYGRKFAHYFLCIPTILGWLAILFANSILPLLVGRFLTGIATGLLGPPSAVYIGETSEPNYRGFLLASITLSISLGILLCHVLGTFLHWRVICVVAGALPILIFLILSILPESPSWLLTQHRLKEAEEAFFWLRGRSQDASLEFESLIRKYETQEKEDASNIKSGSFTKLKANIQKPEFLKPLAIILFFFFIMQFSGVNSVAFYTVSLMESVMGPGYEYLSMILIDIVRVFVSFVACILLKFCYRRTLMLVSGIGTSICMISCSMLMYYDRMNPTNANYSMFSMACLLGYICFIGIGVFPLPWVLQGEMLQHFTRGFSSGLASSFNFICFFIVVKTFVELSEALEIFGVFMCYGLISLIGTVVLFFILPETRNKTLQQIEESFSKSKT